jgi:hypothetical protein
VEKHLQKKTATKNKMKAFQKQNEGIPASLHGPSALKIVHTKVVFEDVKSVLKY